MLVRQLMLPLQLSRREFVTPRLVGALRAVAVGGEESLDDWAPFFSDTARDFKGFVADIKSRQIRK